MASHWTESSKPQSSGGGWTVAALLIALGATGACEAVPPDVGPMPSDLVDAGGPGYVDLVVSFTDNGSLTTCADTTPTICEQQTGPCATHPVLGVPDGVTHSMQANDVLEVGFLCNPILDRTVNSEITADFRVWSTVSGPGGAIVSVSQDGSRYFDLGNLSSDDREFFLDNEQLEFVRFVRITAAAGDTLSIDAIEAYP